MPKLVWGEKGGGVVRACPLGIGDGVLCVRHINGNLVVDLGGRISKLSWFFLFQYGAGGYSMFA